MALVSFGVRLVPAALLARMQRQQADSRQGDNDRIRDARLAERAAQERRRELARRGLGPDGRPLPAGLLRRLLGDEPGATLPSYPVAQIIASRVENTVNLRCVIGEAADSFTIPADTTTVTGAPPADIQTALPAVGWQTRTFAELGLEGFGTVTGLPGDDPDLAEVEAFTGVDFSEDPITPEVGLPFWQGVINPTTQVTTEVSHVCLFCVLPVKARTAIFVGSTYAQTTVETLGLEYVWTAIVYDSDLDPAGFIVFSRDADTISSSTVNTAPLVAHNCFVFNDNALRAIDTPLELSNRLNTYYASGDYTTLETSLPASYGITYRTDNSGGF